MRKMATKSYKVKRFKKKTDATAFQKCQKKKYGYTPSVFKETGKKGKGHYAVVVPKGLRRV